jgi:hypothetical protein
MIADEERLETPKQLAARAGVPLRNAPVIQFNTPLQGTLGAVVKPSLDPVAVHVSHFHSQKVCRRLRWQSWWGMHEFRARGRI